jgi:protocatechuate 3,4-dioxygenase beta subunit
MADRLHRRSFLQLVTAGAASLAPGRLRAQAVGPSTGPSKWVDPPGEETADQAALIDAAVKSLTGGGSPSSVLCDGRYAQVHAFPRFRDAIRANATSAPLTMAASAEPGERAALALDMRTKDGNPLRSALIYIYHTSSKGWYSDNAYHVRASSGDQRHARLFGYVRTDTQGRAQIHTIRPGGYPDGELPQHFHIELADPPRLVTEVVFSDDPRLTPDARSRSLQAGFFVATPSKGADGVWRMQARFQQR